MPYSFSKRVNNDSKTSPLKVVNPIIRKYDGHRQKRIKISRSTENKTSLNASSNKVLKVCDNKIENNSHKIRIRRRENIKAILPNLVDGETVQVEPELLSAVNPSNSTITPATSLPEEILQPVQEICAIAKLEKKAARPPRRRAPPSVIAKKKLLRQNKLMESALEVLKREPQSVIDAREEAYATNYFYKVKGTLTESQFSEFCLVLDQLGSGGCQVLQAYHDVSSLLAPYPELLQDFIPFLTVEQALECGVFLEHLTLTKMADFLSMLDTHFAKTPYQTKRILAALERLSSQSGVGVKEVTSTILPMLKGHPVLTDFLLEMLPQCRPPEAFRTDFDELDEEALSDGSEEGGDVWERVDVPPAPDAYGRDTCICICHDVEDEKFKSRIQHCIPCSTKFINGKVFIQSGKSVRRAHVTFRDGNLDFHRQRLFPGPGEPRKRKRSSSHIKDTLSPNKVSHFSSDDDDRIKSRVKRPKHTKRVTIKPPEEKDKKKIEVLKSKDERKREEKDIPDFEKDKKIVIDEKAKEERMIEKENSCKDVAVEEYFLLEPVIETDVMPYNKPGVVDDVNLSMENVEVKIEKPLSCEIISSGSETEPGDRMSPPVLSIPEDSLAVQIDPILSILEETLVKIEPVETSKEVTEKDKEMPIKVEAVEDAAAGKEANKESMKSESPTKAEEPKLGTSKDIEEPEQEQVEKSKKTGETGKEQEEEVPWKIEEDKVILHTLQVERYCEETFVKISEALPSRTVEDIKSRFQALLNILYKMKAESNE